MILQAVKDLLVEMSPMERASTLSFLAAVVAEAEVLPSCTNPRVMKVMLLVPELSNEQQINLVVLLGCCLRHPEFLTTTKTEREREREQHTWN